jgi:hypothetical protein
MDHVKFSLLSAVVFWMIAFGAASPKAPYVLHYRCDHLTSETSCHGPEREKNFTSREAAISFAESNEQFTPIYVSHREKEFPCWWEYVNPESDSLAKTVDCDVEDRLIERYCDPDDGCKDHLNNHER